MPGKGGFPHPEVEVGCVNTFNTDAVVFVDVIKNGAQAVDIPFLSIKQG